MKSSFVAVAAILALKARADDTWVTETVTRTHTVCPCAASTTTPSTSVQTWQPWSTTSSEPAEITSTTTAGWSAWANGTSTTTSSTTTTAGWSAWANGTSSTTTWSSTTTTTSPAPPIATELVVDGDFEDVPASDMGNTNFKDGSWTFSGDGATLGSDTEIQPLAASPDGPQTAEFEVASPGEVDSISQPLTGLSIGHTYTASYDFVVIGIDDGNTCVYTTSLGGVPIDTMTVTEDHYDFEPAHSFTFVAAVEKGDLEISHVCTVSSADPAFGMSVYIDGVSVILEK